MSTESKVAETRLKMGATIEPMGSVSFWKKLLAYINDLYRASAELGVLYTTSSIANDATENGPTNLGKSYVINSITASHPCRIRIYSTDAYRTADAARAIGTDPTGEHGLVLDVNLVAGNLSLDLSPPALGTNRDTPRSESAYLAVTNKSGGAASITVTVNRVLIEN